MTLVLLILALHERDLIGGGTRSTRGEMETKVQHSILILRAKTLYANLEYNCDFFVQELYASFFFFFYDNVVRPGIKNKNVKIKCSAHDAFLE